MIVHRPIYLTPANRLFLSSKFDPDQFILSRRNKYGMFLYLMLGRFDPQKDGRRDAKVCLEKYPDKLTLMISESKYLARGMYISNTNMIYFNQFVKGEMMEEFFQYMDLNFKLNRFPLKRSILTWMTKSNLHEDVISLRTLEKAYERYRTAEDKKTARRLQILS
ncbi:hypothetical protein [Sphingobacterium spiritivorum]|uniref:hypothetical protein n=1 Tax=Sphingobacterium spiritivorum TaxID=258 RepID=UPI003DA3F61F